MQSKKRFTETNIWDADWFMNLSSDAKLFYFYLNDCCDNIGVWDPNLRLVSFHLSVNDIETFAESFLIAVNKSQTRVKVLDCGSWFLVDFVRFQYSRTNPLSSTNPAHKSYLSLMKERNLWEWFCQEQPEVMPVNELRMFNEVSNEHSSKKTPIRPLKEFSESYKDKDTEKETDKDTDRDTDTAKDTDTHGNVDKGKTTDTTEEQLFGMTSLQQPDNEESAADFERSNWKKKAEGTPFDY